MVGSSILDQSSKYLRKHVEDANKSFPAPWRGQFFRFSALEATLHSSGQEDVSFLMAVHAEAVRVSRVFASSAADIVRSHRQETSLARAWLPNFRTVFRKKADAPTSQSTPSRASACLEYAHISASALRRILKDHDACKRTDLGRNFYDSLWRNQSGMASFLRSPQLLELAAIAEWEGGESPAEGGHHVGPGRCGDDVHKDHQCAVCLEILFKPVALRCGHVFCSSCLKSAAGRIEDVRAFDQVARCVDPRVRCPQCRQFGVFQGAAELTALGDSIRAKYPHHWESRSKEELAREAELKGALLELLSGGAIE